MKTREIPRAEWSSFFDNLSRRQEGWEVTLEILGADIGDQIEQRRLFLAGVTAEINDDGDKIEIMMGGERNGHVTHIITAPTQVHLQLTDDSVYATVQIKAADGTSTLLHLT